MSLGVDLSQGGRTFNRYSPTRVEASSNRLLEYVLEFIKLDSFAGYLISAILSYSSAMSLCQIHPCMKVTGCSSAQILIDLACIYDPRAESELYGCCE